VVEIKVGQKVKSALTGKEYKVKKILQKGSILLQSESGNACAVIHEDQLDCFFDEKENQEG
jgi:sulfate adenylyltransferase subunit 1 (EFTu-like GTPase family)